jgi:hypothetical protein
MEGAGREQEGGREELEVAANGLNARREQEGECIGKERKGGRSERENI